MDSGTIITGANILCENLTPKYSKDKNEENNVNQ